MRPRRNALPPTKRWIARSDMRPTCCATLVASGAVSMDWLSAIGLKTLAGRARCEAELRPKSWRQKGAWVAATRQVTWETDRRTAPTRRGEVELGHLPCSVRPGSPTAEPAPSQI